MAHPEIELAVKNAKIDLLTRLGEIHFHLLDMAEKGKIRESTAKDVVAVLVNDDSFLDLIESYIGNRGIIESFKDIVP